MASVTFFPAHLSGKAMVPPSKSEAHRALLLAALGQGECRLNGFPPTLCDDTLAMINGVEALGGQVRRECNHLIVTPAPPPTAAQPMVECRVYACAAALRMLIPVFLTRGQAVRFLMDPGLFKRPLDAFDPVLKRIGALITRIPDFRQGQAAIEISGFLSAGSYEIDGSQSSQFASGMLMALSHATDACGKRASSTLQVTGPIVSRPYLEMTHKLMSCFHIPCVETSDGVFHLSADSCASPAQITVSGDWTQAAVFLSMNALGHTIDVLNLQSNDLGMQGDARVQDILDGLMENGRLTASTIDCSDIPDLAPMLALVCTQAQGISTLNGVSRLRIKECDRLKATQELLSKLGVCSEVSIDGDTLRIWGRAELRGGFETDARGDHRLVMFLAAAASIASAPITVHGAECISKSWPGFIQTYRQLGGIAE